MCVPVKDHKGFTLIEMAIAISILGIIIISAVALLKQRQVWLQTHNTIVAISKVTEAVTAYRNTYGAYPCPSSLTFSDSTSGFGLAGDCKDTSVTVGAGVDASSGYARATASAARQITYWDRSLNPPVQVINAVPKIRIGAVPFKNLNLEVSDTIDGYHNRIFYAVTENMAVSKRFSEDGGGIQVLNENDESLLGVEESGHFIIFSAGKNGAGAYTPGGSRQACANTGMEADNCNLTDNVFRLSQAGTTPNGSSDGFDDVISFSSHEDISLWEQNPGSPNMAVKKIGKLGIGVNSKDPSDDFAVDGVLIARNDPGDPAGDKGRILSDTICNNSGGTSLCFPSATIAGELKSNPADPDTANTGGLSCPSGEFMVAIRNGQPDCKDDVQVLCPTGTFMTGIKANGELECSLPPVSNCPETDVALCGQTLTLPEAVPGEEKTVSIDTPSGGKRYARYICKTLNNSAVSQWTLQSRYGSPCDCTPSDGTPKTVSCASPSECGDRFSGTKTTQKNVSCPEGATENLILDDSNCVCINSSKTRTMSCPSGFNGGNITQINNHVCGSTPKCSGWLETGRDCKCSPSKETRVLSCPSGYSGSISEERSFTCPSGSDRPGSLGPWNVVKNDCTCVSKTVTEDKPCPVGGQVGEYVVETTYKCPTGKSTKVVKNTCALPPPTQCFWKKFGGVKGSGPALSARAGGVCDCTVSGNVSCSQPSGSAHDYYVCQCTN